MYQFITSYPDKYDRAISFLQAIPDGYAFARAISHSWNRAGMPDEGVGGCLFRRVCKNRRTGEPPPVDERGFAYGCLTQVKCEQSVACTKGLTLEIIADKRIPRSPNSITKHNLYVFAEWRRRLDIELA